MTDEPEKGMRCPDCGCARYKVIWVRPQYQKKVRKVQCEYCGRQFRTIERIIEAEK